MKYTTTIVSITLWAACLFTLAWLQSVFAEDIIENLELEEAFNFMAEPPLFSGTNTIKNVELFSIRENIITSNYEENNTSSRDFNLKDSFYNLSIQKKSLSCESSATSDILETLLLESISEDDVIAKLPTWETYNELPIWEDGKRIWGNPNLGFVWNIDDASQSDYTWYGVYESPIASVYNQYGFETEILNREVHGAIFTPEYHLTYLLENLQSWNMVQLWGDWCTDPKYDDWILENMNSADKNNLGDFVSAKNTCLHPREDRVLTWHYYDEQWNLVEHTGLSGEHAFILLGWKWDISNPSHVRVWDTDTGYHEYETIEWMRKWAAMDYRSIVISKKDS